MTYELAKQLKDAGFPQNISSHAEGSWTDDLSTMDETVYFPTLSELIEACGEDFNDLLRVGGVDMATKKKTVPPKGLEWRATAFRYGLGTNYENGATHEEAVANLWIFLHKS
jgi:hypothetical protein